MSTKLDGIVQRMQLQESERETNSVQVCDPSSSSSQKADEGKFQPENVYN